MSEKGKISMIIDLASVAINLGREDGIYEGQKFLIYELGEMISDPDTGEELEQLEIVKGNARVIRVQQKVAVLEGYKTERVEVENKTSMGLTFPSIRLKIVKSELVDGSATDNPLNIKIGDLVRPLE